MCEVAGIEVRYPLLSDDLVAFAARLPPRSKIKGSELRHFFKHAMRDYLPRDTLTKSKHGFGLPFGLWLRSAAPLQEFARENLESLRGRGIFRPAYIDSVEQAHRTDHAIYFGVAIWGFLMLEQWFRAHVDGRLPQEAG
jgi:asparagine synthase (glutamine-hydrolysing)